MDTLQQNLPQLATQAAEYCKTRGYPSSGTVVFYNGEIAGWMNTLRDPNHWAPGCIAVSLAAHSGNTFHVAAGGDDYNGAEQWQPLSIKPIAPPAIGEYWQGQGGYYAGIIRDDANQWHLILADHPALKTTWGKHPNEIPGGFSRRDGMANTRLILAAEPQNTAALHCTQLVIDGHQDYYWPAQCENNLLFANLPAQLEKCWHWSSTQYSSLNAWGQRFEDGYQALNDKDNRLAVRAVRRLPIYPFNHLAIGQ